MVGQQFYEKETKAYFLNKKDKKKYIYFFEKK